MSEQGNDRLEEFFQKAASRPDVPFNEEDWKKLEARLDAHDALMAGARKPGSKIVSAVAVSVILLFTAGLVVNDHYRFIPLTPSVADENLGAEKDQAPLAPLSDINGSGVEEEAEDRNGVGPTNEISDRADKFTFQNETSAQSDIRPSSDLTSGVRTASELQSNPVGVDHAGDTDAWTKGGGNNTIAKSRNHANSANVVEIDDGQILRHFRRRSPVLVLKNKQKAIVELPGAEEVETGEAESVIREEQVSDPNDRVTMPRLSLLLSFSPDFSGTSLSQYSAPGKAFGAMIHYHIRSRWSVSAGIIKNNKQYTGKGEDYQPPAGYWNYYTNGKIPNSIYGACDVLEFPLMVQYTIRQNGKNKLLASAGTSSYVMLKESYQYQFDEPNPGARERWDSRSSSRFLLNMVNFAVAYEREVFPGFMIGVEPYVKIPIEEIGWVNLKLFSTGAAVTMRYTILRKNSAITNPSRGPD
jgi:hypothetical protein